MTKFPAIDMAGALRLTRQGRLKEAVCVLRGKPGDEAKPQIGVLQFVDDVLKGTLESLATSAQHIAKPPALEPGGGRFEEHNFSNEAGARKYKLFVPKGYKGLKMPLLVMLHGCTQSADDFAAGTRMNDLAEAQNFLVAYPEQARTANMSKCWNWFNTPNQHRDQGEASLIAGITRQVMADFSVLPGQVYVAGLSAGGAAAAIMGSAYPELYAAVGVHSGLACGAASDMVSAMGAMKNGGAAVGASARLVPTIVFHGDKDLTVNIANAGQVIAQAKGPAALQTTLGEGEAGGRSYTQTIYSAAGNPVIEEWVLHGAGHAWSGGSNAGSFTDPHGPNASQEMLRFFLQQQAKA